MHGGSSLGAKKRACDTESNKQAMLETAPIMRRDAAGKRCAGAISARLERASDRSSRDRDFDWIAKAG